MVWSTAPDHPEICAGQGSDPSGYRPGDERQFLRDGQYDHSFSRPLAFPSRSTSGQCFQHGRLLPVPGQTIYGASKAAVKLFTEGLYSELLDTPVRVTVVFPGAIGTNIAANSGVSMPGGETAASSKIKMTAPPVAAEKILNGMEKDAYRVLIGSDCIAMDAYYRLMPKHATRIIYNQMKSIMPK